jgi:hypothetical protein
MNELFDFPKKLGHELINQLLDDFDEGLKRITHIEKFIANDNQRDRLCNRNLEINFAIKLAELARLITSSSCQSDLLI